MVKYSQEMLEKICTLLAQGYSLKKITEMDDMPSHQTIYNWAFRYPEFYEAFDKAREFGTHAMSHDLIERLERVNSNHQGELVKMKMIVDHYRWFIGKLNPRKYGDKTVISGDKENPVAISLVSALDQAIASRERAAIPHNPSIPVIDVLSVGNALSIPVGNDKDIENNE